jgi:hypothetical protein
MGRMGQWGKTRLGATWARLAACFPWTNGADGCGTQHQGARDGARLKIRQPVRPPCGFSKRNHNARIVPYIYALAATASIAYPQTYPLP